MKIWTDKNGYKRHGHDQYVHRTLAERVLGRMLRTKEQVHHIDEDRSNNTSTNLVICPSQKYHMLLHSRQRIVDMGGYPNTQKYCKYHDKLHDREEFSTRPSSFDGLHNVCRHATNEYRKLKGYKSVFTWKRRLNQQYCRVFSGYTNREVCKL